MASSTDEAENFFLLYKLIVVIGTKAVKDMFDQLFPPNKSCSPLSKFKSTLIGVLKHFEYIKVFPPGMPPSSSDEFDIPLMVSLMRHIAPPNTSPIKITDTPPSPTDTSLAADLSRMKWYRNSLSHASRHEIDASEFDKDWRLLSETISRIGGSVYKSQCDALKNSHIPMDERERLHRELNERRSLDKIWSSLSTNDKLERLKADTAELIKEELRESTFVETKASKCALEILKNTGVVLLTGGAGRGKSRMGLMVLHHFKHENSTYCAIKLNSVDEWQTLDEEDKKQKLIVLLDNIFGDTNCTFSKGNNEPILDDIYVKVRNGNVKVVITIRNTIRQHCTEIFENHRLFSFDLIDLNAPEYKLLSKEKQDMLVRHFSRKREGVQVKEGNLIDNNGIILNKIHLDEIMYSDPVHGFPLTVYRFVNNEEFLDLKSRFFTSPTDKIKEEINTLRRKGKDVDDSRLHYAVLVYTALNGNSINRNDTTLVNEINSIIDTVYGKKIGCKNWNVVEAIDDMLKQMYLIKDPNHPCCHFRHITLQESVILSFVEVDESRLNTIIPILGLKFIVQSSRSEDYTEKYGEVVLKVPQKWYPLLAERVAQLFLADEHDIVRHRNIEYFLSSELFDNVGDELLGPMVDWYLRSNVRSDDIFTSGKMNHVNFFDVCLPVLLLRHAAMMKVKISTVILILLRKIINESMQSSSYFKIRHDCKVAIVDVVYKLCSKGDVNVVTDALQLAKESNIHVSEDQFLHIFEMHESTIYIYQCILESFWSLNRSVMDHFSEKLKSEAFDVNLFLKRIYTDPKKRIPLESIKYLYKIAKFDDNLIEWLIKLSCKRHLMPEVKYLLSLKDRTDTNTVYIECFLKCEGEYCNGLKNSAKECHTLFEFLLTKVDHNVESINFILKLMQEKTMHCGNFLLVLLTVVDRGLLNFNTILSLACDTTDIETVKWVLGNISVDYLDIKQALVSAVTNDRYKHHFWKFENDDSNTPLEIVKCLLTALDVTEFNCEEVLNSVWACKNFKIIQYFLENAKYDKVDTSKIVTNALQWHEVDFIVWILQNGDKIQLDFNFALSALFSSRTIFRGDNGKTLIQKVWPHVEMKTCIDQRKIVDEACKNGVSSEVLIWFLEVFDHKLLDINQMLTISYRHGYLEVVKYIVKNVHETLYVIDMNIFKNYLSLPIHLKFKHCSEIDKILLSKSGFTVELFQTLMNEAISSKDWNLVNALLIHCENPAHIFDIVRIVQAFIMSGKFNLLSRMLTNEETKHCIQFIDIDTVMTGARYEERDLPLKYLSFYYNNKSKDLHSLLTQIWTICKERCDINSIIQKHCSDKGMNVDVLKWIFDNVEYDCIDLDLILQSFCRNVETSFVTYMFSKVDKYKLDVKSAFLEACRSNVDTNRPTEVIWGPFPTYTYNPKIILIDFLLQQCGADMFNISEGVTIALHRADYQLIYYFLANKLCKDMMIDMKSLLNSACRSGEYDLALWIMQNIQHIDLDLSSAIINACMYKCKTIRMVSTLLSYEVNYDSIRHKPYCDENILEVPHGLWCAMYILDKIDNAHSLDYYTALSIARNNENERMVQWLEYIFESGHKALQPKKSDRNLQQGTPTVNTQDISSTTTDMNPPDKCEDATALSKNSTSEPKATNTDKSPQIIASSVPSTEMKKDNNEHLEPSQRNTISDASSNRKRTLDNETTSNEERSSYTLKKCKKQ